MTNEIDTRDMALSKTPANNALAESDQARAIAEVQAAMAIAKRFPRDYIQAVERIKQMCTRATLAQSALYSYSRGGTEITGPSIRLAEAVAQGWGNMQFGIRELEQRNGESTVEAFAWDLETNTRSTKVFQVPHIRQTKKGSYALSDPRDIYEMVANQGARRMRACILAVVPGDVTEEAVAQCEVTLKATVQVTPERIKSMIEKFASLKVSKAQIEAKIQRRIDAMVPANMVQLGKIYTSIKDGMSAPADWFPAIPAETTEDKPAGKGTDVLKDKMRAKAAAAPKPNTPEPDHDPETGEVVPPACPQCGAVMALVEGETNVYRCDKCNKFEEV